MGFDPNDPIGSGKLADDFRALSGYWIPLAVSTQYEFNSASGLPTIRTEETDSGYGYPIGAIVPTPLFKSRAFIAYRNRKEISEIDRISFSTGPDSHWGTANCEKYLPSAYESKAVPPIIAKEIVIDGALTARRHKGSDMAFIIGDTFVWKIINVTTTSTKGRLR